MITLRSRHFYANLTKPTYQVVSVGGVPCYQIGSMEADDVAEAIALGYVIDGFTVIDKTANIELVQVIVNDIPKLIVYIPTNTFEGMDGFAQVEFTFRDSPNFGVPQKVIASVQTFPLANFHVSCAEQPNGIDVWAIDIEADCESEAINGDAVEASITDIIFTAQGERPRCTNYGSPIPRIIWNNLDSATAETLLDKVIEAVTRYERRVSIDRRRASMTIDRKKHTVFLTIPYAIIENQKKYLYRKKFAI